MLEETALQEIAERLLDRYGSRRHFEIIKAKRIPLGYVLEIRQVSEEKTEEAENESD